jgi:uncharacterized phiE125 gp8 family phage protein
MSLRVVEKPTSYPVSLAEAKAQLSVTDGASDTLIAALIAAATSHCEGLVQRSIARRTYEWVLTGWRSELCIPIAPVVAADVASIKYVSWTDRQQATLDPASYVKQTRGESVAIFPQWGSFWPPAFVPSPEPIVVRFAAGYENLADVPPNVKVAILLQTRHLFNLGERDATMTTDTVVGVGSQQFQSSAEARAVLPKAVQDLMLLEAW